MKKLSLMIVTLQTSLLLGCGGSSQTGGETSGSSTAYKATYTSELSVSESASEKFDILVETLNGESSLTSASNGNGVTYSIETVPNANIMVENDCQNIAVGKPCTLMTSLKKEAADTEEFNFVIKLSNGVSKTESATLKKHLLSVNLNSQEVLPTGYNNYVSVTNTSNVTAYFDKPYFVDQDNMQIGAVLITDNTCTNKLDPEQSCHFLIKGENGVVGQLKLALQREPLADVSFSNVVITGTKTQDIPTNAAKGGSYTFTYTFTNTNRTLAATGVSFTNDFAAPDFTIDTAKSSCNGVTSIAANSSCTWQGTFTPGSEGNKSMSSTLHYAKGSNVTLTSSSLVVGLLATTPINTAPNVAEKGWAWPTQRFEPAKKVDNTPCNDAEYDKLTGLMWVKDGNFAGQEYWNQATNYADNLTLCGYNDWRLPTINELKSLVNYSDTVSPANWLNANGFSNIQMHPYWSSTVYSILGGSAWLVNMDNGAVFNFYQATTFYYVLPVRGPNSFASGEAVIQNTNPTDRGPGQWPTQRFEPAKKADNTPCNDTEYDKLTGLMWVKDGNATGQKNWNQATSYAKNLTLCGYNDWRLPTINELKSLVNYSDTVSPANWLNANGFSNIQTNGYWNNGYWSSTVYSTSGGLAWNVSMDNGYVDYYYQTSNNYVLPVRGPN
ncbi:DUF1566 domain-containing protein [Cysteiniphilum marinum]|uniref:Lcl C-terminal domain-containing protein n=1 Tax=Cysteiniphilum marinum TaxID=2774191 RepID=UPI00193B0759|nr:DUF1566 domain-containing protein [Cysteiniphilum marinum]